MYQHKVFYCQLKKNILKVRMNSMILSIKHFSGFYFVPVFYYIGWLRLWDSPILPPTGNTGMYHFAQLFRQFIWLYKNVDFFFNQCPHWEAHSYLWFQIQGILHHLLNFNGTCAQMCIYSPLRTHMYII